MTEVTNQLEGAELIKYWRERAQDVEKEFTELRVRHSKLKDALGKIAMKLGTVEVLVADALRADDVRPCVFVPREVQKP
jgi:hypothetical protein